jgi:hypothetical protein
MPMLALAALAAFSSLYLIDDLLYYRIIALWSFNMTTQHPFIDAEYVAVEIKCFERGLDVYNIHPCDPPGGPFDYSPLWLRCSFLAVGPAWVKPVALLQDALFAMSLALLPKTVGWGQWLIGAAILSPTMVFAMERSNIDVTMLALCLAGTALLQCRWAWRGLGYAGFVLAGVLKVYPLVLLAFAVSERPRRFGVIVMASCVVVAVFLLRYGTELRRAIANVPIPSSFGDGFAALQLGRGLAFLAGVPSLGAPLTLVFCAAAFGCAWRLAKIVGFAMAFSSLDESKRRFLVAGALLFCGCFLAKPCIGYRGIILLPALPGMLSMAAGADSRRLERLLRGCAVTIVLAMWNFVPMGIFGPKGPLADAVGPLPFFAVWAMRELAWWLVFCILLAVLSRFVVGSTLWREFARRRRSPGRLVFGD